jgi:hypothetical protein
MLEGETLYLDLWDHKPPGIHLIDAVVLAFGFDPGWSLWAVSTAAACAAAGLAMAVLLRAFERRWAIAVGALHACLLVDPELHEHVNLTEIYGAVCQWLLLWTLGGDRRPVLRAFLAGICGGAGVLMKPTVVALPIAFAVDCLVSIARGGPEARRDAARVLVLFGAGAALLPAATIVWLAGAGATMAAWDCVVGYNAAYAGGRLGANLLTVLKDLVTRMPVLALGVPALVSMLPLRAPSGTLPVEPSATKLRRLALVAFPLEVVFAAFPGRFYGHYYITLLPVLSLRSASALSLLGARMRAVLPRLAGWLAPLVVALSLIQLDLDLVAGHRRVARQLQWQRLAVDTITERSGPEQSVLIWGAEPGINLLAGRRIPVRYVYLYPLFKTGYTSDASWEEFFADLRRDPPDVILEAAFRTSPPTVVVGLSDIVFGGAAAGPPRTRAELTEILASYRREVTAEGLIVWLADGAPLN